MRGEVRDMAAWLSSWGSGAEQAGIAMLHRHIRHARRNRKTFCDVIRAQRIMAGPNPRAVRHPPPVVIRFKYLTDVHLER